MMLSNDRRREIAAFLRSRRARLQPEQVDLPRGTRRRTPGLRREEVAALAGMSTEWYTWLEQARDVQPSAEMLRRIACALRLEPGESQHLLTLAGYGTEHAGNGHARIDAVSARLQRLLDRFGYCPAWAHGERWDFLAWNRAATVIHGDLASSHGMERNGAYLMFMNPRLRQMLVDWEAHARDCVAKLRVMHAHNVDDPWFNELVLLLQARSPEFSEWWNDHNVQLPAGGLKRYRHPEAGVLSFDFTTLDVAGEVLPDVHLIAYVPADAATQRKMERLFRGLNESLRGRLRPVRKTA